MTSSTANRTPASATILIVEDNDDTRELWSLVLQDAGFRVREASSLQEGLALLLTGKDVDLVVTDYGLPDGTGEAMLRLAYEAHGLRRTPALLCTANRCIAASQHARVVHKPLLPEELVERVQKLLLEGDESAVA